MSLISKLIFTAFTSLLITDMGCNMYAACWRKPQLFMHAGSGRTSERRCEPNGDGDSDITDSDITESDITNLL